LNREFDQFLNFIITTYPEWNKLVKSIVESHQQNIAGSDNFIRDELLLEVDALLIQNDSFKSYNGNVLPINVNFSMPLAEILKKPKYWKDDRAVKLIELNRQALELASQMIFEKKAFLTKFLKLNNILEDINKSYKEIEY
jgi:hypothetical protein